MQSVFCTRRTQFISDKNGIRIDSDQQFENGKLSLFVEEYEVLILPSIPWLLSP